MDITLKRFSYNDHDTLGEINMPGVFHCYTLEPSNSSGKGCIALGRYEVKMQYSPHFNKAMPHLQEVQKFTDILIHPGNVAADTHGCICVGLAVTGVQITESVKAFDALCDIIQNAINTGDKVFINIINDEPVHAV